MKDHRENKNKNVRMIRIRKFTIISYYIVSSLRKKVTTVLKQRIILSSIKQHSFSPF